MDVTPTYETEPNAENFPAVVTRLQAEIARLEAELAECVDDYVEVLVERDEARRVAAQLLRVARAQRRFGVAITMDGERSGLDEVKSVADALAALEPGVRELIDA